MQKILADSYTFVFIIIWIYTYHDCTLFSYHCSVIPFFCSAFSCVSSFISNRFVMLLILITFHIFNIYQDFCSVVFSRTGTEEQRCGFSEIHK